MPILRVVSDRKLTAKETETVKGLGHWVGYDDPRMIWVEVSDGLTQADVMYVSVTAEKKDFRKPEFVTFCRAIGDFLRDATLKSVEVTRPTNVGMHGVSWHPTEEGAKIYGKGH